jgi:hypothetical protein
MPAIRRKKANCCQMLKMRKNMNEIIDRRIDRRLGNSVQYYLNPPPDIDMLVPDTIRDCAVFIGTKEGEDITFRGTGFLVAMPHPNVVGKGYIYLVTAKHCIVDSGNKLFLRANTTDGKSVAFPLNNADWVFHDDSTDVAVVSWVPPSNVKYRVLSTEMFLTKKEIQEHSIGIGNDVFMTGLFTRHVGNQKNLPIIRTGNVAMMPDEPVKTENFGDMEAYLIEARSIEGISGCPVFVLKEHSEGYNPGIKKFFLMGLMHGHWDLPLSPSKNDAVNLGIAVVVPAQKILDILHGKKAMQQRIKWQENDMRRNLPKED